MATPGGLEGINLSCRVSLWDSDDGSASAYEASVMRNFSFCQPCHISVDSGVCLRLSWTWVDVPYGEMQ